MHKETQATLAILLATAFWGMTFSFIKDAVTLISPFNFLFWRFCIASGLLYIVFFSKIQLLKNQKIIFQGISLGVFLAGTVIFQTIGLQYTNASTASFITGLTVILVPIFTSILNKQFPSSRLVVSLVIAVTGIGLITLTNGFIINVGDLWVMLCAFCFAIYIILAGKFSSKEHTYTLTFIQLVTITALAAIADSFIGSFTLPTAQNVWTAILFCAIFASVIAFILQLKFQRHVSATKTAIIFALEPVFATLTAYIYLGEKLTGRFIIGCLLIFSSIFISELKLKKKVLPQD